jgi:CRISPR/Cas system-associated protein endoribonuclease Cas2
MINRLNQYRILWLLVFFDLPTETKKDRKAAGKLCIPAKVGHAFRFKVGQF